MIRNKIVTAIAMVVMLFSGATLITAAPPEQVVNKPGNSTEAKTFRPDSILVRFKPGTPSDEVTASHANINPNAVKSYRVLSGLKQITLPPGISVEKALANYRKNPNVLYAEPDYQYPVSATPNESFFASLWALNNTGLAQPQPPYGGTLGSVDADINAQEAWDNVIVPPASGPWNSTTGGHTETVVAVIDSGVDIDHPDLINNMWINPGEIANGIDDDGNGYIDDINGWNGVNNNGDPNDSGSHGTHVAGTIVAEGNNSTGVIGAAWHAKLIACRAGTGSSIDSSAAIACLEYLYELKTNPVNPVNIVVSNNSWGGTGYSQAIFDAIDANRQAGILFVAAAGNSTVNNDSTAHYPSSYHLPNIISVASTSHSDTKSSFSNYGRRSVLVGAPGEAILSTVPVGSSLYPADSSYDVQQGTSMAAPQVSGLAALVYAQDSNRDWKAIKNLIIASGTPISPLTSTTVSGRRIRAWDVDGTGALSCVNQTVNATLQPQASSTLAQAGQLGLAVLNINCDVGAGNVIVSTTGASAVSDIVLLDDGTGYDKEAGDGVYSAYWSAPSTAGAYTLTFPDGQTASVTVDATMNPYRQAQSVTAVYETFTDWYAPITLASGYYSILSSNFPIKFGDHSTGFSTVYVSNGWISFHTPATVDSLNAGLPSSMQNTFVVPFWDDLILNSTGTIHLGYTGTTPNKMVVEWRDVPHVSTAGTVNFQVVFTENSSDVKVNYANVTFGDVAYDLAASATIGMQIHNSSATEFSYNSASISNNSSYLWQTNSGAPTSVNAGIDQNVSGNTLVNLSGSATDPDGGIISYSWAQLSGSSASLTNATTATPSFTAPNVTETLSFIMTAQDDAGFTASDVVNINVTAAPTNGVLQLLSSTYNLAENAGSATITVSRSSGSLGAISVDYTTSNGTATSGSDYVTSSGTLSWADGDSTDKSFSVSITDDVTDEADETLTVNLSNVIGGASLGTANATLTITDNDVPGTLSFSASNYSVTENGITATITVSRSGGSDDAVAVNYASANDTATAGSDYTSASGTLNWANADSADKSFTVSITDDALYELDETLTLSLSGATNGATLGTSSATLTIAANDAAPGTLAFSSSSYSVAENGITATITVSRSGGSDGAVAVNYASANGTAIAGSDYTSASGTLNWANADSADKSFTVSITDDALYELDETLTLSLSGATNGAALGTSSATLTIAANDALPGTLAFSSSSYSVAENGITATITVSRSGGSDGAVAVNYASANGTAIAGSDYTSASGTLNWANADSADKTFTVSITDDALYELDETLNLSISGATNGAALGTSSATLTIAANDAAPGTLAFSSSSYSVAENGTTATITVSRSGGSDGAVAVNYASANGTATAGADYASASGTLNWANADSASKTFTVSITDDAIYEGNETISLSLNTETGGSTLGTSTANLTIVENESAPSGGSLTFSTTSYTTSEANSTLSLIVRRIGGSAGAVSVDYITSNITAAAGSDYSGASSVLNWADGDSTDKSINITISNDSVYEPTESFKVTLSNVSSGASIGNSIATINITDDDAVPGTLSLSSSTYSVQENNSVATLTVNRSGGSNGAVSVNYASANGTAVAGSDYSPATGSLTWADGDSASKSFIVVITNDTAYEADETLTLNLSGATNGAALGTSSAVLTILGNDAAPGTLAFTSSTYSVSENGINATISVSRTAGSDGAVSVDFNSTDITAISGDDYQSLSGSLNWNNGDSAEKTFIININDNVVADGDKTVSLNLTNVSGGASLGISGSTLTIVDNENSNQAPAAPNLVSPGNGATGVDAFNMSFTWDTVTDPDGDAVNYQLYYCEDANFAGCTVTPINTSLSSASMMFGISGGMGLALVGMVSTASRRQRMTSMLMVVLMAIAFSGCGAPSGPPASPVFSQISYYAGDIQPGKTYYWKVVAVDGNGGQSSSQVWSFTTN